MDETIAEGPETQAPLEAPPQAPAPIPKEGTEDAKPKKPRAKPPRAAGSTASANTSRVDFSSALAMLKAGLRVERRAHDFWVSIQWPDSGSANTKPYLYQSTGDGDREPWLPSTADILATDWQVVA